MTGCTPILAIARFPDAPQTAYPSDVIRLPVTHVLSTRHRPSARPAVSATVALPLAKMKEKQ